MVLQYLCSEAHLNYESVHKISVAQRTDLQRKFVCDQEARSSVQVNWTSVQLLTWSGSQWLIHTEHQAGRWLAPHSTMWKETGSCKCKYANISLAQSMCDETRFHVLLNTSIHMLVMNVKVKVILIAGLGVFWFRAMNWHLIIFWRERGVCKKQRFLIFKMWVFFREW